MNRTAVHAAMLAVAVRDTPAQPAAPRPASRARVTVVDFVSVVDAASARVASRAERSWRCRASDVIRIAAVLYSTGSTPGAEPITLHARPVVGQ